MVILRLDESEKHHIDLEWKAGEETIRECIMKGQKEVGSFLLAYIYCQLMNFTKSVWIDMLTCSFEEFFNFLMDNGHSLGIRWAYSKSLYPLRSKLSHFPIDERTYSCGFTAITIEQQFLYFCFLSSFVWFGLTWSFKIFRKEDTGHRISSCQMTFVVVQKWNDLGSFSA